jgi:GT2 family glycosyltransferase
MFVTLLTCTPDSSSDLFKRHIAAIKQHTCHYEHIIIDNAWSGDFNHARDINRAMKIARNRYFVTLDDDVIVRDSWLSGLLESMVESNAAIVGGIHRWENGVINHSGGWVLWDGRGNHYDTEITKDSYFPYVCSAVCLMDLEKFRLHGVCFDEGYQKYFQEVDLCLRMWELEERVICTPRCEVFHLVGQAMNHRADHKAVDTRDKLYFASKWIDTGKMQALLEKYDSLLQWGGITQIKEYDKILNKYDTARKANDLEAMRVLAKEIVPFTVSGHGKNIAAAIARLTGGSLL